MDADRGRSARPWPLWLAGGLAAVSILAMLAVMIGWQQAEQAADDQAAQVASVRADAESQAEALCGGGRYDEALAAGIIC